MITNSFQLDLFNGVHQPGDIYQMALYTKPLGVDVAAYVTQSEVLGKGYKPGGITLTGRQVTLSEGVAFLGWASPLWPDSTIVATHALIYNYTRERRSVAVLDLGGPFTSSNGPFIVELSPELLSLGG